MKRYIAAVVAVVAVASTALGVATNYYQIGGQSGTRDQGWNFNTVTNSSVTPTEFSWSFGAPDIFPDLSNVVITVTAVETNDVMFIQSTHLAGTNGVSGRLDGNEVLKLKVSYEDPDGLLTGLKVDSVGPWWNTGSSEETIFSDGTTEYPMASTANGEMADYDTTGLTQLTLANTGTWSMLVYQINDQTTSGLGGFRLEYIADVNPVILPPEPPAGKVGLGSHWGTSRCDTLAEGSDFASVVFSNNVAGDNSGNRRFYQSGSFGNPAVGVGDTLTISFTTEVGSALPISGGDRIFRASFFDTEATTANAFSFRADYGNYGGTTLTFGSANVKSMGYVGSLGGITQSTTAVPTNALVNQGDSVDCVISIKRTAQTDFDISMSLDETSVATNVTGVSNFNTLDAVAFRMNSALDNHLIITNLNIEITNDTYDWYSYWSFYALLEQGVNDGFTDDPDGDGMANLLEYALDGDPLSPDAWRQPVYGGQSAAGVDLVYRRRRDAGYRRLNYSVGSGASLLYGGLTNATTEVGSEIINADMEYVTNRVSTSVGDMQFMQLGVTQE